jgi:hypothetical protein
MHKEHETMAMTELLLLELSMQTAGLYLLGLNANITGRQAQNAQHAGKHLHPVTEGMLCVFHFFIRYVTLHVYITLRRQFMQHIQ